MALLEVLHCDISYTQTPDQPPKGEVITFEGYLCTSPSLDSVKVKPLDSVSLGYFGTWGLLVHSNLLITYMGFSFKYIIKATKL